MNDWIRTRVVSISKAGESILDLQLVAESGQQLPASEPGAHIDIRLPNGLIRQYSIHLYDPSIGSYSLGIGLSEISRGGSSFIHRQLQAGDSLEISAPRNNFPLNPDAKKYLFIAGGIGITPILSMIRWCDSIGKPWQLLYCVRSRSRAAYIEHLPRGGDLFLHADDEKLGHPDLESFISQAGQSDHIYCCGPSPLMDAVRGVSQRYLPSSQVHFELFSVPTSSDTEKGPDNSFVVELAQSQMELTVPADKSILDVLEEAGIMAPFSCREGLCRTCECRVLEGEVDHRDYVLSDEERDSNSVILQCVSRAKSAKLVLDI
ncbi:PDR/VanB family oxidoreductase [Pseudomonas sp. LABIM340]|uniref:PDR/VanB family oxidoreductase n=1 Tax=Pseudomonas sp. LABIM340 TaxID=3156585 RepID=UPI0032AF867A